MYTRRASRVRPSRGLRVNMLLSMLVWLTISSVVGSVQSTPSYTLSLILPSWSDFYYDKIDDVSPLRVEYSYLEAIQDVNNYFGQHFTFSYSLLYSDADPSVLTNRLLQLLSSASPPLALIGPFYLDRFRYIAPLAEMGRVALVSPRISLSQMARFLPHSNRMSLSMQAAQNTYGDELIRILQYHGWSHIALIITQSPLQHLSPYEQNVKNVRFGAETLDVKVVATAWIPPLNDYGNDTVAFETAVKQEIEKIWSSGATVIVLSIEQITTTYEVLMQAANNSGLINTETAWISLNVGAQSDKVWEINQVRPNLASLVDGMIVTATDLTDYFNTPLSVKTSGRDISFIVDYPLCQLVYDSVWAVAFAVEKSLRDGVSIVRHNIQIGGVQFQRWKSGEDLIKNIKETDFVGLSGLVSFNDDNVRLTWNEIYNIRLQNIYGYYVGYCGFGECVFENPIYWYNSSIRSPIGEVDICRHRINVLLPGGRYGRYIDFSDNEKDRKYFGWAIDLFEEAATSRCLGNFKYYRISNMTWDEAIELVGSGDYSTIKGYEGTEFHVAVGPFAITPERSVKADFTRSIKSVSYRVAILRPEANTANFWEFFKPFSWQLWLLTAVFFVLSGFFVFLLEKNRKTSPAKAPKVVDSIFVSISALYYTHDQESIKSNSGRGYFAIVCFVVLVLCACFTANLSVFLLKRQETSTYEKLEDIHDGVIGASNATGSLSYLQRQYPRLVFENVSPEDWSKKLTTKEITAYVDDSSVLEVIVLTHCEIVLLDEKLHVVNAGFALKYKSPYKRKLDDGISGAWSDNFIEELEQKYFEWPDECQGFGQVAPDESLKLRHLGGLFIILSAVGVSCLIGDFFYRCAQGSLTATSSGTSDSEGVVLEKAAETTAESNFGSAWTLTGGAVVGNVPQPDLSKFPLFPTSSRGPLPPIDL